MAHLNSKVMVAIGWILALSLLFVVVYGTDIAEYNENIEDPSKTSRVMFNSFHRVAWTAGLGWIVFACFHGYGGTIHLLYYSKRN